VRDVKPEDEVTFTIEPAIKQERFSGARFRQNFSQSLASNSASRKLLLSAPSHRPVSLYNNLLDIKEPVAYYP
jgi:hypothetical protein